MPLATDCGTFGSIGVPHFVNPGNSVSNFPFQGLTWFNSGPYRKPISSELTSSGTWTLTDKTDRLVATVPTLTGNLIVATTPIATTPYTLDVLLSITGAPSSADSTIAGLCLSDGTKYISVGGSCVGGSTSGAIPRTPLSKIHWTNRTTVSATSVSSNTLQGNLTWVRVTDDGTTRICYYSLNGKDFSPFFSEATNTFLTPTLWGIFGYYNGFLASSSAKVAFYHLQSSGGILGDAP